jgi:hypothetical protein
MLFLLFLKKPQLFECVLFLKKINFPAKNDTLKQNKAPDVDEIKISRNDKLVVASAMDAANKNLI